MTRVVDVRTFPSTRISHFVVVLPFAVLYANNGKAATGLTFVQVLARMRKILKQGSYSQIPQLTSSKKMDTSQNFYLVPPNCSGAKRAVLIGINYEGQKGELSGCHNDCLNMKDYIMSAYGFEEDNIVVLMDDGKHIPPTRANILSAYQEVAAISSSGDAVFCHYSGELQEVPCIDCFLRAVFSLWIFGDLTPHSFTLSLYLSYCRTRRKSPRRRLGRRGRWLR